MTSGPFNKIPAPKVPEIPTVPQPKKSVEDRKWSFAFSYWAQEKNFGLGDESAAWMVSIFEKFKELSQSPIDEIRSNPSTAKKWRMHGTDWSKQMGISRTQFYELIPPQYHSEEDYEIIQFQITTGTGRVIGFLDEDNTFQVVLLDPKHNFCLAGGKFDYRITTTRFQHNQYEEQQNKLMALQKLVEQVCKTQKCAVATDLSNQFKNYISRRFVCLDDYHSGEVDALLASKYGTVDDLMLEAMDLFFKHHGV